jgi:hypothetical protein
LAKMFDHVQCFLSQWGIGDFDAIILSQMTRSLKCALIHEAANVDNCQSLRMNCLLLYYDNGSRRAVNACDFNIECRNGKSTATHRLQSTVAGLKPNMGDNQQPKVEGMRPRFKSR